MSDLLDLYELAIAGFDERVRQIKDEQWGGPTPCTEWDVRALVNHLVYESKWAPPLFKGKTVAEVGNTYEGDLLGDDPKSAWERARDEALETVRAPGALERTVNLSSGDTPGSEYLADLLCDAAIHSWDLARAIGADERIAPELIDFCRARWGPMQTQLEASGSFGKKVEVPEDADEQTRLLALLGRRA
jgi:uncharacterized protein (TIGR03086 family)